jgi:rare lipoprotein A
MNQLRWTCLTTAIVTAIIAPIASVRATNLPVPAIGSRSHSFLPSSLPVITPLTVTELKTDVAVPAAKVVPQVSVLPIIKPLPLAEPLPWRIATSKTSKSSISLGRNIFPPVATIQPKLASANVTSPTSTFNANFQAIDPNGSTGGNEFQSSIPVTKPQAFTTQLVGKPIPVIGVESTAIIGSATVRAEIDPASTSVPTVTPFNERVGTIDRVEPVRIPQINPVVTHLDDRADAPSFDAGLPVFIFDNEHPQQIVATTIAQIGNDTVAPEPSIAIPVQRPKQLTIPVRLPQTEDRSIVKIEEPTETVQPALDKIVATQTGQASWYGIEGGVKTANGERYNPNGLTAAHRTLPFGTKVRVTSLKTGKMVVVRINDRGPFHSRRILDVSAGAAAVIGLKNDGVGQVKMEILGNQG